MTEFISVRDQILTAYLEALGDRDPDNVPIGELLPAIGRAVPGVRIGEIQSALRWKAEQLLLEASALEAEGRLAKG